MPKTMSWSAFLRRLPIKGDPHGGENGGGFSRGIHRIVRGDTEDAKANPKNKAELRANFRLAEQLGAQIATVYGEDIPGQIAEYAKASRVSKIVVGRSHNKKKWFAKANLADKLTASAPNIDIYIIPDTQPTFYKRFPQYVSYPELSLADTAKTTGILVVCTLIGLWFNYLGFREANIITVYILGCCSMRWLPEAGCTALCLRLLVCLCLITFLPNLIFLYRRMVRVIRLPSW